MPADQAGRAGNRGSLLQPGSKIVFIRESSGPTHNREVTVPIGTIDAYDHSFLLPLSNYDEGLVPFAIPRPDGTQLADLSNGLGLMQGAISQEGGGGDCRDLPFAHNSTTRQQYCVYDLALSLNGVGGGRGGEPPPRQNQSTPKPGGHNRIAGRSAFWLLLLAAYKLSNGRSGVKRVQKLGGGRFPPPLPLSARNGAQLQGPLQPLPQWEFRPVRTIRVETAYLKTEGAGFVEKEFILVQEAKLDPEHWYPVASVGEKYFYRVDGILRMQLTKANQSQEITTAESRSNLDCQNYTLQLAL